MEWPNENEIDSMDRDELVDLAEHALEGPSLYPVHSLIRLMLPPNADRWTDVDVLRDTAGVVHRHLKMRRMAEEYRKLNPPAPKSRKRKKSSSSKPQLESCPHCGCPLIEDEEEEDGTT